MSLLAGFIKFVHLKLQLPESINKNIVATWNTQYSSSKDWYEL